MSVMIEGMLLLLSSAQLMAPIQNCEVKTKSWCLVSGGVSFDEETTSRETRVWKIYGGYLGERKIIMVESRSCSSVFASSPHVKELSIDGEDGPNLQTVMKIDVNADSGCEIVFKVPFLNGRKDDLGLEFLNKSMLYCSPKGCFGLEDVAVTERLR